uniref:Uncharacterized protein n=1 Tax=Trypanosoma congolense (strain IL3000) TaxID=1068625 RepID=G0UP32_TRYCI|nr:hypothetical protein, unlikely [Trypanosoma congolense IL3000]
MMRDRTTKGTMCALCIPLRKSSLLPIYSSAHIKTIPRDVRGRCMNCILAFGFFIVYIKDFTVDYCCCMVVIFVLLFLSWFADSPELSLCTHFSPKFMCEMP